MKTHQAIATALHAAMGSAGADVLFGLVGEGNVFMVDHYVHQLGGRYVRAANEAGAMAMAVGWAKHSNRIGVCTVTQGPGLTNTVTPLVEGVKSSTPVVLLAGDTPADDLSEFQNIRQRELVTDLGAGFEPLRAPGTVVDDLNRAFSRAWTERRPIVFNMPYDFLWQEAPYHQRPLVLPDLKTMPVHGANMDNAMGIIASARRPVVLAGRGAIDAQAVLRKLAARLDAPLATTLRAKDLFRDDPFNLGICGTLSTSLAADILLESDCVIAFGASLNKHTGGLGSFFDGKKRKVLVTTSASDLGQYTEIDAGLLGDPGLIAEQMIAILDEVEIPGSGYRDDELKARIAQQWQTPRARKPADPDAIDVVELMRTLDQTFPQDRIFLTDGGRYENFAWPGIHVQHPGDYVHSVSFGAIGIGLATAMGAAISGAGKPTLVVAGDGSFELGGFSELLTAVREKLDLTIVVCNDSAYGAEHDHFVHRDMNPAMALLEPRDFAPIAQAMGVPSMTAARHADLPAIVDFLNNRDPAGPCLIDVKLDPDQMHA